MACYSERAKKISAFSVAALFLLMGILLLVFWPTMYHKFVISELAITNSSKGFSMWKETPIPMYLSLYLYNWTNSKDVLAHNWKIKPKFEQVGPYVFLEHHSRVNLKWNPNDTITYQQVRKWNFQPHMSNGRLDDDITTINVMATTVAQRVKDMPFYVKVAVNLLLKRTEKSLDLTKTAGEWMFDGFDDPLLDLVKKFNISLPFDKFGWFYGRNNSATYDGTFTMYTGASDLELLGIIEEWNGYSRTNFYKNYCGYVNGTSGELWPPVKGYKRVSVFSPDICSSAALFNSNAVADIEGIEGSTYVGTDYLFDNGTKYPDQKCFNGARVMPSGVRDVSKCKFGAPAFVSYPHFYQADPIYRRDIEGMHPDPSKHSFSISLEPKTGVPLGVDARLQINLLMSQIKGISLFENVKELMVPVLWFEQSAALTSDFSGQIKLILVLEDLGLYTGYGFIAIGILVFLIALFITFRHGWRDDENKRLLSSDRLN